MNRDESNKIDEEFIEFVRELVGPKYRVERLAHRRVDVWMSNNDLVATIILADDHIRIWWMSKDDENDDKYTDVDFADPDSLNPEKFREWLNNAEPYSYGR